MAHEVYVSEKGRKEYILNPNMDPFICNTDAQLLDLIASFHMDANQEISSQGARFQGHPVDVYIYPQFTTNGLVMNRRTSEVRRVKTVGVHRLVLFNTDDKYKADLQRNGYILYKFREVDKREWMPLDDGVYTMYYPGSVIGKDPMFDDMEYQGMTTL